jgi:hypothetical protein
VVIVNRHHETQTGRTAVLEETLSGEGGVGVVQLLEKHPDSRLEGLLDEIPVLAGKAPTVYSTYRYPVW